MVLKKRKQSKKRRSKRKGNHRTKRNSELSKKIMGGSICDYDEKNAIYIGNGAAGYVYLDLEHPESVFKLSTKNKTCREWGKEAKIYDVLNTFNIDTDLCKMIKMKKYSVDVDHQKCCMELTRAINPIEGEIHYTIQPVFQEENVEQKYDGRGLFLGINNLIEKNIFTKDNISDYMKDLGILLARLHYKVKNDGYDLELFISKEPDGKTVIYIGDFDLSDFYDTIDDKLDTPDKNKSKKVIDNIAWSLEAFPYFPIEGELYEVFSQNYISESEKYDQKSTAKKILDIYTGR